MGLRRGSFVGSQNDRSYRWASGLGIPPRLRNSSCIVSLSKGASARHAVSQKGDAQQVAG
jgi:hypothetical protein